jgi:3-oxoacyl-[acyl-carrier protein] reductase
MTMFDLTGRRALVTGSGQGVGFGIAQRLAQQGAAVAINDLVAERAEQAAKSIDSGGQRAVAAPFDVTDYTAVQAGIAAAENALGGPLDVLVNNAGVPPGMGLKPFCETEPEDWARQINLNTYGVIHCCRTVINGMSERGHGRIVTISSGAGTIGLNLGVSPYAAGKGGAISFMRHLALESARTGVTANTIAIGLMNNDQGEDVTAHIARSIPVGRLGTPEDIAALVLYLVSDEASWMTGQTVELNGGNVTT